MSERQSIKLEFSLPSRKQVAAIVGAIALASGVLVARLTGSEESLPSGAIYAEASPEDCNYGDRLQITEDAPAFTRGRVAVLSGTLFADGVDYKKENGFDTAKARFDLIDDAMNVLKVSTCGAYQPKVEHFGYSPVDSLTYEEFCAEEDGKGASRFVDAVKESAAKEVGYNEADYVSTIVLGDFNPCGKKPFGGMAMFSRGKSDVLVLADEPEVLVHEVGHLPKHKDGSGKGAGLFAGHGSGVNCTDKCRFSAEPDHESAMSAMEKPNILLQRDAFNGYDMLGGGVIAPSQIKEVVEEGNFTIDSLLTDSNRTKLLALPIATEDMESVHNEFIEFTRNGNSNITEQELDNLRLTHLIVELSDTRIVHGPNARGNAEACDDTAQAYEAELCKSEAPLSVKAYLVSLKRDGSGQFIHNPGSGTYRFYSQDFLSAVTEPTNELRFGKFTIKPVDVLPVGKGTPSVGSASITVTRTK